MDTVALLPQSASFSLCFLNYLSINSKTSLCTKAAFGGTGLAQ
jgi:hypothetical protein